MDLSVVLSFPHGDEPVLLPLFNLERELNLKRGRRIEGYTSAYGNKGGESRREWRLGEENRGLCVGHAR